MIDWKIRILLFTEDRNKERFQHNSFLLFRDGEHMMEVDLRFPKLYEGLEYIDKIDNIQELCIFERGESLSLNGYEDVKEGIVEGIYSMREEKYWIAHEIFEDYWHHYGNQKREFFQGVVLFCVSMVHFQMHHHDRAKRIFGEARDKLLQFIDGAERWEFSYPLNSIILEEIEKTSLKLIKA